MKWINIYYSMLQWNLRGFKFVLRSNAFLGFMALGVNHTLKKFIRFIGTIKTLSNSPQGSFKLFYFFDSTFTIIKLDSVNLLRLNL